MLFLSPSVTDVFPRGTDEKLEALIPYPVLPFIIESSKDRAYLARLHFRLIGILPVLPLSQKAIYCNSRNWAPGCREIT